MVSRRTYAILVPILLAALCSGCLVSGVATSATPDAQSATPVAATAAATPPESSASTEEGAFACDLPLVESGTVAVANLVDVRIGEHGGYDRVVFEFDQGTPAVTLDRAMPPFTQDGSGLPIQVDGQAFLGVAMMGGTKQTDAGTSSYTGPTDFDPSGAGVVDLVEAGDFERQSTWYIGLRDEACVRIDILEAPPRIVIDVAHP